MVAVMRKDGTTQHVSVSGALGLLFAVAALGGFAANALAWVGGKGISPNVRIERLERQDSLGEIADSALSNRITDTMAQLADLNELTERMAALRCLDPASKELVRQAQVPCARIYRDLGMAP